MPAILIAIAIGTAFGVPAARRVQMTAMPQLVALFNGVGGGAAAHVALIEVARRRREHRGRGARGVRLHHARRIGVVQRLGRHVPEAARCDDVAPRSSFRECRCCYRWPLSPPSAWAWRAPHPVCGAGLVLGCSVSLLLGVLFVLPVGGADVPIVISLLNAATG